MHAPSRSSYDPGEKLTVTGLSSLPLSAVGLLREKSITERTGPLNEELSWLFKVTLEQMYAQLRPDFRFLEREQINDSSAL